MAVPRRRQSPTRRDRRRANHKIQAPQFNECSNCGEPMLPHRICKACGHYAGRSIKVMVTE